MKAFLSIVCTVLLLALTTIAQAATQQAKLTWTAVSGATSYVVERKTGVSGTYTVLASPTAVTYTDPNLTQGTVFVYRVSAMNAVGTGVPSDEVSTATAGIPGKVGPVTIIIEIIP